jgi:hypothetical protein
MKSQRRNWRYSSSLSLTSALYIDGWSTTCPGRFTPGKQKNYPSYGRLGGPRGLSGWPQKMSPIPKFEHRTVQIVTISYTDYAISANISPQQISVNWNGVEPRRPRWQASNQPSDPWHCTSSLSSYDIMQVMTRHLQSYCTLRSCDRATSKQISL